ncbi:MAG TPA: hypothetical protein VND80_11165 [Steroidobacteraceae bacterium]|nr:hypothetical protein [Steroidobacteraceae bacterium]
MIYIDSKDELIIDAQALSLTCPHCQAVTHLTAAGVPRFAEISRHRPKEVGAAFLCSACAQPVFLKFAVRAYGADRIELAGNYTEVERVPEIFPLSYLPAEAHSMFKEALACYTAGCFNAFGAMCRRTAQSLFRELGERGKLELFDKLQEIRELADLEEETFASLRAVLFGSDADPWPHQPTLNAARAGILLEAMRDLLYQTFVRKARLRQAMTFRRFVAPAAAESDA